MLNLTERKNSVYKQTFFKMMSM